MADRKYKNIHLVDEKKRNTNDHNGQQLNFLCHLAVFVGTRSTLNFGWRTFFLYMIEHNTEHSLTIGDIILFSLTKSRILSDRCLTNFLSISIALLNRINSFKIAQICSESERTLTFLQQ